MGRNVHKEFEIVQKVTPTDGSSTTASDGTLEIAFEELANVEELISVHCEDTGFVAQPTSGGVSSPGYDNSVTLQGYQCAGSEGALVALSSATQIGPVHITVKGE